MSEASNWDMSIDQGADFSAQFYWTDAAGNPFTVLHPIRMDIRAETGQVIHSMASLDDDDLEDPDINFNSDSGLIQLVIPASATSSFPAGRYQYDMFVGYSDGSSGIARRKRLLHGSVYVYGSVTRDA